MIRKKGVIISIAAAVSVALVSGINLAPQLSEESPSSEIMSISDPIRNLGMTYIKVTPMLSAYYDLDVDSGVLVTEVTPGSPMELANIQPGDIIVSCNGTALDEQSPLLEIIRGCRPGDNLSLEIYRDSCCHTIECCPYCGTPDCDCCETAPDNEQPKGAVTDEPGIQ